jgi:hypothetical protein
MQKILFIILNVILSSNIIWIIFVLPFYFLPDDNGFFIFGYGTLLYCILISILKIIIMEYLYNNSKKQSFIYKFLDELKSNLKHRIFWLILFFFFDLILLIIFYSLYMYFLEDSITPDSIISNISSILIFYIFSFGGVLSSYIAFLIKPWVESRFKT